jgi:hypothetical protein
MDHSTATEQRREIEDRLRADLERRRGAYYDAKAESARLELYYADLGLTQRDGRYALRIAIEAQHRATEDYREALVEFNRFILDGKLPDHIP